MTRSSVVHVGFALDDAVHNRRYTTSLSQARTSHDSPMQGAAALASSSTATTALSVVAFGSHHTCERNVTPVLV